MGQVAGGQGSFFRGCSKGIGVDRFPHIACCMGWLFVARYDPTGFFVFGRHIVGFLVLEAVAPGAVLGVDVLSCTCEKFDSGFLRDLLAQFRKAFDELYV